MGLHLYMLVLHLIVDSESEFVRLLCIGGGVSYYVCLNLKVDCQN